MICWNAGLAGMLVLLLDLANTPPSAHAAAKKASALHGLLHNCLLAHPSSHATRVAVTYQAAARCKPSRGKGMLAISSQLPM